MDFLRRIDRNTTGNRCDVTPLFADAAAFTQLLDHLIEKLGDVSFDRVAGIDALGFILGTGLAVRMHKGVIPLRKGGKLPVCAVAESFVDYTRLQKSLEVRPDAIAAGERVLLVDEWIETGAQIDAAIKLIEGQGGTVAAIATINADPEAAERLRGRGYRVIAAING